MDAPTALKNFRPDTNSLPVDQLADLLQHFGLEEDVPVNDQDLVDVAELVSLLPVELDDGVNGAHKELKAYLHAIPPRRRVMGVFVRAGAILGLLLDRLEFFEGLSRNLVRICRGRECPHFEVCPFSDAVETLTETDRVPCAVERDVVRNAVENFVYPQDGRKPAVDPRRPEQGLLFRELVEQLVKKTRLGMYLQMHDMLVDHYEVLKDGDMEKFDTMNQVEHPLLAAWDRTQNQILRTMKELGITPEFQIRQGLYIDEESQIDAEKRARELAAEKLTDNLREVMNQLPEGDPNRALLQAVLERAKEDQKVQ